MAPEKYLLALGRFTHAFSRIEMFTTLALWVVSGVGQQMGRALLSGIRVDQAISVLRRVMDTENITGPQRDDLEPALQHLGMINKMRNDILHYGADVLENNQLMVSNFLSAHLDERLREVIISPQMLDDMTFDLDKIGVHFDVFIMRQSVPGIIINDADYLERLQRPWRYIPPQPIQTPRKTRKTPPK
jgi:hypothetical protein